MGTKLVHINYVGGDLYVLRDFCPPEIDNSLPGGGAYPDQGLPGYPDQGLPAIPGVPDNTLPTNPPPQVPPGTTLVMIRTPDGKWKWATISPGQPVPTPLPEPPPPTAQPKAY